MSDRQQTPAEYAAESTQKQRDYVGDRDKHTAPLLGSEQAMKREAADREARGFWEQTVAAGTAASRGQPVAIAERASVRAAERVEDKPEQKQAARAEEAEAKTQGRGMRM